MSVRQIQWQVFSKAGNDSPSPWGEGRDEGGRSINLIRSCHNLNRQQQPVKDFPRTDNPEDMVMLAARPSPVFGGNQIIGGRRAHLWNRLLIQKQKQPEHRHVPAGGGIWARIIRARKIHLVFRAAESAHAINDKADQQDQPKSAATDGRTAKIKPATAEQEEQNNNQ